MNIIVMECLLMQYDFKFLHACVWDDDDDDDDCDEGVNGRR